MAETEKDVTLSVEQAEANRIWQEYLQKCCEVGQLLHSIDHLESQKLQIEKNIEVTQRAVKSLANKHRENQQKGLTPKPQPTPETQTDNAGALQ